VDAWRRDRRKSVDGDVFERHRLQPGQRARYQLRLFFHGMHWRRHIGLRNSSGFIISVSDPVPVVVLFRAEKHEKTAIKNQ